MLSGMNFLDSSMEDMHYAPPANVLHACTVPC
jgi:hypothetical protein